MSARRSSLLAFGLSLLTSITAHASKAIIRPRARKPSGSGRLLLALLVLGAAFSLPGTAVADTSPTSYPAYWTGCGPTNPPIQDLGAAESNCDGLIAQSNPSPNRIVICADWHSVDQLHVRKTYIVTQGSGTCSNTTQQDNNLTMDSCPLGGVQGNSLGDAFGAQYPDFCLIRDNQQQNAGCPCDGKGKDAKSTPYHINTSVGNETETFTDYRGVGPFPLTFSRSYNSLLAKDGGSSGTEKVGIGWTTNIGSHLRVGTVSWPLLPCLDTLSNIYYLCPGAGYSGAFELEITVWHPDGGQALFTYGTSAGGPDGVALTPEANATGQLFFVASLPSPATGSGYRYLRDDGYSEYYDNTGDLVSVMDRNGLQQVYQYTAGQLTSITDPAQRSLQFTYYTTGSATGLLQTITDPAGYLYTYGYDANGNLSTVTHPDKLVSGTVTYAAVTYVYENSSYPHALTGIVDENLNRYMTFGYDSAGRATSSYLGSSTAQINKFSVSYATDAGGRITGATITEPSSNGGTSSRTLNFTTATNVDQMTSSTGRCAECGDQAASRSYDANGYVSSETDFSTTDIAGNPVTDTITYLHDATGLETSRTEASGTPEQRTITTSWDASRQPATISEPGRTTAYTYDSVGRLLTKTVTDTSTTVARTTAYTYNTFGLVETITDPLQHVTRFDYASNGDLTAVTRDPTGLHQVTQITTHDANGSPTTIIEPNGATTTLAYDGLERLISRTVAVGTVYEATTTYAYDSAGELTQVTLPGGASLSYLYDGAHRLTDITDSMTDNIHYTLDSLGNRTREQTYDPAHSLQKQLERTYNSLNQLTAVTAFTTSTTSRTTHYTPDAMGNVIAITDPMGNPPTTQGYDALNRLVAVVDPQTPVNGNTGYTYDPLDRVQYVADPVGLNTHYLYDAFGDVTEQQSFDTGTTTYSYDLGGKRLTKTDARGVQVTYTYDGLDRLTSVSYPDASRNIAYSYDQGLYGVGHLTGMTDASGTTAYQYDARGNTLQKTVTIHGHTFPVSYTYDSADDLTGMTYPSGLHVDYDRDAADRVSAVKINRIYAVSNIGYEPFGPINSLTLGNGVAEARSYDLSYRLTGITTPGNPIQSLSFGYNDDDDITSITDGLSTSNSQTLGYDVLNRLTAATGAYGSQSYQYDLDGNRMQEDFGGTVTLFGYAYQLVSSPGGNQLLSVGAQGYSYDAMGDTTGDGTHAYDYDAAGRLTGFDSTTTAYLYNGLGQRAVKFPADDAAPVVTITSPAGRISGTVTVTASVVDTFGVSNVHFMLDGVTSLGTATAAPYQVSWDTSAASVGVHTLTATATDPGNNTATSAPVSVITNDVAATAGDGSLSTSVNTAGGGTLGATLGYPAQVPTFAIVAAPAHGTVVITDAAAGSFTYTPTGGYAGSDSFTFEVTDSYGAVSNTATESVTVNDVAATATADSLGTNVNVAGNGTLGATLAYPTQTLTFAVVTAPAHGTVTITNAATGAFTYTPAANYIGADSFTFTATDAYAVASNTATESLTVNDVAATANAGTLTAVSGVAANDTLTATLAYTGQTLTFAVSGTGPSHGTLSITAMTGAYTYTPTSGYVGGDSFKFTATSGGGAVSNQATVSVTVNPDVTLSPASRTYTTRLVNTTSSVHNFTLTNDGDASITANVTRTGTNAGQFTITSNGCSGGVSAHSSCTVGVQFTPTQSGNKTASLTVTDSGATTPSPAGLNGVAVGKPTFSSTSLSFPTTATGSTSTKTVTVTNPSSNSGSLDVTGSVTAGAAFSVTGCGGSSGTNLSPGENCTLTVTFHPSTIGPKTGTVTVNFSATSGSDSTSVSLSGTAN